MINITERGLWVDWDFRGEGMQERIRQNTSDTGQVVKVYLWWENELLHQREDG